MFKCTTHGVNIEMPFPYETDGEKFGIVQCKAHLNSGIKSGGWEQCERARIDKFLPNTNIIEFGAGTGFLSCFANKKLHEKRHIVFEANPLLIPVIQHHRDINGCTFDIVNKAYNGTEKVVDYPVTTAYDNIVALPQPVMFRVEAVNLGDVIRDYGIDEYALIMDVEGAEFGLLYEAEALQKCIAIILEIHKSGHEAGGKPFDDSADLVGFLAAQGLHIKDRCGCVNWVGAYGR